MVKIDKEKCIGCGACTVEFPEVFELKDGKSVVLLKDVVCTDTMKELCCVEAIG